MQSEIKHKTERNKSTKFKVNYIMKIDQIDVQGKQSKDKPVVDDTERDILENFTRHGDHKQSKKKKERKQKEEEELFPKKTHYQSTPSENEDVLKIGAEITNHKKHSKNHRKKRSKDNSLLQTICTVENNAIVETETDVGKHRKCSKKNKKKKFKEDDISFESIGTVSSLLNQNDIIGETEVEVVDNRKHHKKKKKKKCMEEEGFVFDDVGTAASSLKETDVIAKTEIEVEDYKKHSKKNVNRKFKQDIMFEDIDTTLCLLNQKDVIFETEEEAAVNRKHLKRKKKMKIKVGDVSFEDIDTSSSALNQNNVIVETENEVLDNKKSSKKKKKRKFRVGDVLFEDIDTSSSTLNQNNVIVETENEVLDNKKSSKKKKKLKEKDILFKDFGTPSSTLNQQNVIRETENEVLDKKSSKKRKKRKFKEEQEISLEDIDTSLCTVNQKNVIVETENQILDNKNYSKKNKKWSSEEFDNVGTATSLLRENVVILDNGVEVGDHKKHSKMNKRRKFNEIGEILMPDKSPAINSMQSKENQGIPDEKTVVVENPIEFTVNRKKSKKKKRKNCKEVGEILMPDKITETSSIQLKENRGTPEEETVFVKNPIEFQVDGKKVGEILSPDKFACISLVQKKENKTKRKKGRSTHFDEMACGEKQQREKYDDALGKTDTNYNIHSNERLNTEDCFGNTQIDNSFDHNKDDYNFSLFEDDCKDSDSDVELLLPNDTKDKFETNVGKRPRRIDSPQERRTHHNFTAVNNAKVNEEKHFVYEQNKSKMSKVKIVKIKEQIAQRNQSIEDTSSVSKQTSETTSFQDETTTDLFTDKIRVPHTKNFNTKKSRKSQNNTFLKSLNHPMRFSWDFPKKDRDELRKQGIVFNSGVWGLEERKTLENNVKKVSKILKRSVAEVKNLLSDQSTESRKIRGDYGVYRILAEGINRQINDIYVKVKLFYHKHKSKGKWTKEEEEELMRLHAEYGRDWAKLGEQLERSRFAVHNKVTQLTMRDSIVSELEEKGELQKRWKTDEIKRLRQAIEQQKENNCAQETNSTSDTTEASKEELISWRDVSRAVKTRHPEQCRLKWLTDLSWQRTDKNRKRWGRNEFRSLFVELDKCVGRHDRTIDWKSVIGKLGLSETEERMRKKWRGQKVKMPNSENLTLREQLDWMLQNLLPKYENRRCKRFENGT